MAGEDLIPLLGNQSGSDSDHEDHHVNDRVGYYVPPQSVLVLHPHHPLLPTIPPSPPLSYNQQQNASSSVVVRQNLPFGLPHFILASFVNWFYHVHHPHLLEQPSLAVSNIPTHDGGTKDDHVVNIQQEGEIHQQSPVDQSQNSNGRAISDNLGGNSDQAASEGIPVSDEAASESIGDDSTPAYNQGIIAIRAGFRVRILKKSDLNDLWNLVLERRELNKLIRSILASRDYCRILGGVGAIVLILTTITNAEVAGHSSVVRRAVIFSLFFLIFTLYMIVTFLQLEKIYDPALGEARRMYSSLIRKTNLANNQLLEPNSIPRIVELSENDREMESLFDDYCREIGEPLPIGSGKMLSCIEVVCVLLLLLIAFILNGSSPPKNQILRSPC